MTPPTETPRHVEKLREVARRLVAPVADIDQAAAGMRDTLTAAGVDLGDPAQANAVLATSTVFAECLLAIPRTVATDRYVVACARSLVEVADHEPRPT